MIPLTFQVARSIVVRHGNPGFPMPQLDLYLMSPPPEDWTLRGRANFRSAAAPSVDARRARAEWVSLADAIESRGGRVCCLLPRPGAGLTGLPYTAEAGQLVQRRR